MFVSRTIVQMKIYIANNKEPLMHAVSPQSTPGKQGKNS